MENPFIKKHGQANFEEVKEKITQKIDTEIHSLNQQAINESLQNDFPDMSGDFSTPEIEALQKEIERKKMLRDNLENKDYYSLN